MPISSDALLRQSLRSKLVLAEERRRKGRSREEVGRRPTTLDGPCSLVLMEFSPEAKFIHFVLAKLA